MVSPWDNLYQRVFGNTIVASNDWRYMASAYLQSTLQPPPTPPTPPVPHAPASEFKQLSNHRFHELLAEFSRLVA